MELNKYIKSLSGEVKRSEITLAAYNPRKISGDARKRLKANIKRIGIIGGLIWNKTTGNLLAGHQRILILDELNGYDGTEKTDYLIRLDIVELDTKTEVEQNIFLNNRNIQGEYDNTLLADLIPQIDYELAGLSEFDLNMIAIEVPVFNISEHLNTVKDDFKALTEKEKAINAQTYEEKKQSIIDKKEAITQGLASENAIDKWVTVSFTNVEEKVAFMELLGYTSETKIIKGEPLLDIVAQLK